jgi:SsrA-binding protein
MAKKGKKDNQPHEGPRIRNRKARHEYNILEKLECGIALAGTEVKSLREGSAKIDEAYVRLKRGELWLVGATISPYSHAAEAMSPDPTRDRKLLAKRRQIQQLESHVRQKGKTLVPLAVYFKNGWAKCTIGVAEGKRSYDKRRAIKERDQKRDIERALRGR